jgi:hypothetical protein
MIKTTLAVLAGAVAFIVLVTLMDGLAQGLHTFPDEGGNFDDPAVWAAHIAATPVWIMLIVVAGQVFGTFVGAFTASRIDRSRGLLVVSIVAALAEAGTISNAVMLPHPLWMTLTSVLLIPVAAYVAL